MLRIKSPYGVVDAPAFPIHTVPRDALAMPIGQGHTDYGRFANGLPANPMQLLPADIDPSTGGLLRPPFGVAVVKTGEVFPVACTSGSYTQQDREFVRTVTLTEYHDAVASGYKPHISLPLPEGYDPAIDFYPPHEHAGYRWAMVVDLDRCIGCSACVVACYAENNVAIVGKEQVLKGREMSWLRVQRYFDAEKRVAWWLPMLCQHCDCAPCEPVCPVYAPHHSKDGLNNQVYNRCFGTRFCSQNDPYKVRRFNFFTYTRQAPLDWQLNPDVTVRQKGVMEKCSFCVQRIIDAKTKARNEGRQVLDGEFTTACAQTCPTNALIFGNLLDPNSRVSQLVNDARAYQVLGHLNTKPAVIYLKRVTQRHI
jgi:molybdopterin-containing oxidoreductase family iron-sulfur binding subunit